MPILDGYKYVALSNIPISINEDILIISPYENYYGDIEVTVNVSDGEFIDAQIFNVTVLPVNDDPFVINTINDLEVLEGNEEINGAIYHILFLSLSKTFTSISCAIINAVPDPIAIRIEIKS